MKKIVLALAVLATGLANAQSSTATVPAANASATSTTQAPSAPSKIKFAVDLEARATVPQKNAALVEAGAEMDINPSIKLNARHSISALTTVVQRYDGKNEEGAEQQETELPYDPYFQYKYRLTSPDVKDHNSSIVFRYYAPTSAASVAEKNDGSLRVRYDYLSVNNLGPVGLTTIYSPFIQKYFNEDVVLNEAKPRNEFAFGNQLVLSFEYQKLYVENVFDVRLMAPMRSATAAAATTPAKTYAYFETYVGMYINQANTLSVFALYTNETDMIDGAGYEYPVTNGDTALYSVGLRGSF